MAELLATVAAVLGVISTLSLFTMVTGRSNPFFSYALHTFIGTSMAWYIIVAYNYVMSRGIIPIQQGVLAPIGGVILGLLMYTRYIKNYSHLARIPIAISIGIGTGLTIRTVFFSQFTQQIQATILPIWTGEATSSFNNIVTMVSAICTMLFFFFSREKKGALKVLATIGEYMVYMGFGTYFASNYLGRSGLFIGRMNWLLEPTRINITIIFGVLILATYLLMQRMNILEKFTPE